MKNNRKPTKTILIRTAAAATVAAALGVTAWQALGQDDAAPPAASEPATAGGGFQTTESGLRYKITQPAGEPMTAKDGDLVMVHYTGKLEDGTVFDTSLKSRVEGRMARVEPLSFTLGKGEVIPGWEEGIRGMKVGEKRTLVIPPQLAYKERGAGGVIPPNATLTFDVYLVGDYRPEPAADQAPAKPAGGQ